MYEVCFVFSQAAGFSWVQFPAISWWGFFAKEIVHKPKQNSRYAQVFPNISIALEQIHIFKTSTVAELTGQAVVILKCCSKMTEKD